jgi:phosphoglycolate phosphatase-like HAD superfamily hydrolase
MKLIILDIDGTMTKSEQHHLSAFLDGLHGVGIQEVNTNWGGYEHITDTFIFKENYRTQFGEDPDEEVFGLLEELITDSILEFESPKEVLGAKAFVDTIQQSGDYVFAYATGALKSPAKYKLDETGIFYEEPILIGANGFDTREEIVTAAIKAAKDHYKVNEFEKIISAGDGLWDLTTARNLNLPFLGIGNKNIEKFTAEGAKNCKENWLEIDLKYLDEIS